MRQRGVRGVFHRRVGQKQSQTSRRAGAQGRSEVLEELRVEDQREQTCREQTRVRKRDVEFILL